MKRVSRIVAFVCTCLIMGLLFSRLGFGSRDIVILVAIAALLSLLTLNLPWGGRLFPLDALLISICLLRMDLNVVYLGVIVGLSACLACRARWHSFIAVGARNALGSLVAISLWRQFQPVGQHESLFFGSLQSQTTGWMTSAAAVPALLLTALAYFIIVSTVDTLARSRREFGFGEFWFLNFGKNLHHHLFTVLLGAIMAIAYNTELASSCFILFAFPVVLTRDALRRSLDLRTSRMEAIKALASSVDARDKHTYDHSSRVARLARMLAREMGFSESTVEMIEGGALLHDIGKLSVDAEILTKPGPLDARERDAIRMHPAISAEVVSRVELLRRSVEIVRHHHERPDGRGYPEGLRGHEIPVGARILNVADAFDAMISDRPYRKGKTVDVVLEELRRGSGTEFDPVVVEYLIRLVNDGKLGWLGIHSS